MARILEVGSSVRVVRGISETEKHLAKYANRVYTLERYTQPHGYALITDEYGSWHVHPESLDAAPFSHEFAMSYGNRDYCSICGVSKDYHAE